MGHACRTRYRSCVLRGFARAHHPLRITHHGRHHGVLTRGVLAALVSAAGGLQWRGGGAPTPLRTTAEAVPMSSPRQLAKSGASSHTPSRRMALIRSVGWKTAVM